MAITIKGVRVESLTMTRGDEGSIKISGDYSLISSADKVIARQTFGDGYKSVVVSPTGDTIKKMDDFIRSFKTDLNQTLGMEGGE